MIASLRGYPESQLSRLRPYRNDRPKPWLSGSCQQKAAFDSEGYFLLEVPYREDQELVMDILKHGPEVEVLSPKALRDKIAQLHEQAVRKDRTPGR